MVLRLSLVKQVAGVSNAVGRSCGNHCHNNPYYRSQQWTSQGLQYYRSVHSDHTVGKDGDNSNEGNTLSEPGLVGLSDTDACSFPDPRDPKQSPLASISEEQSRSRDKLWKQTQMNQSPPVYRQKLNEMGEAFAIGRRKRSRAKIWLKDGSGNILVNGRSWVDYFPRIDHRDKVLRPLDIMGMVGKFDLRCEVVGGGVNGQTEAVRHGIARALQNWDPHNRPTLKEDGLLTRDSRVVESKKYGKKKARKSFQWVKR